MKSFSTDLANLLASEVPLYRANLFAIGPCQNGAMIYATDFGDPVTYDGNVYEPTGFGDWSRGEITTKVGIESNSCTLTILADNYVPVYFPGTSGSALLLDAIKFGLMDNAPVTISTAYMPVQAANTAAYLSTTGPTGGSLVELKFSGVVAPVNKVGMTKAEIEVRDMLYLLNAQTPQMLLQASCRWVLYGSGCTLSAASYSRTGAVGALVGTLGFSLAANLTPHTGSGTFTQGYLTWTSGKNAGLSSYIAQWTPGGSGADVITLDCAPIFPVTVGDAFTIYQGCAKTYAFCNDFSNTINYGGTPNVPVPEAAI